MDLAIVVVANSKDRFAYTLDEIKDDQDHSIYKLCILANQGHSMMSPIFDPSINATDLDSIGNILKLGIVYHVTKQRLTESIRNFGLLAQPSAEMTGDEKKAGRIAIHFLFTSNDPSLKGKGTQKVHQHPAYVVFDLETFHSENKNIRIFLSPNGVLLVYTACIASKYLTFMTEEPTVENVIEIRNVNSKAKKYFTSLLNYWTSTEPQVKAKAMPKETKVSFAGDDTSSKKQDEFPKKSKEDVKKAFEDFTDDQLGRNPEDLSFNELQQKVKELNLKDPSLKHAENTEEEIEEVPSPSSPVSIEVIIDTENTTIEKDSCSVITWRYLDNGFFYNREPHPDIPMKQRTPIRKVTGDYELWSTTWDELQSDLRTMFRRQGYSANTWKSSHFSGLAPDFIFTAWNAAKHFVHFNKEVDKTTTSPEFREQCYNELNKWGCVEWNQRSLEPYLNDPEFAQDKTVEVTKLNYDWGNIKEQFINFFNEYCNPKYNRKLEQIVFSTNIVSKLLQQLGELKPQHPWVINIVESLRKHVEQKEIKLERIEIQGDLGNLERNIEEVEEAMEVEPVTSTTNEFEVDYDAPDTTQSPREEPSSSKPQEQPDSFKSEDPSSKKQDKIDRILMAMLEAMQHNQPLPPTEKEPSKWRVLDTKDGITGYGIQDSHSFEHQFLSWRTSNLTEEELDHPHQVIQWSFTAEFIQSNWKFDYGQISKTMKANTEFKFDESRQVTAEIAEKSHEKIMQRNQRVKEVVDNYYSEWDKNNYIDRKVIIEQILKAGFLFSTLSDEERSKGFNSTVSLNLMIANLGNFARSQKPLHPNISPSALTKAIKTNKPEESIFTRFLEGMTSHIMMLTETYEVSDIELAYLKDKAKLESCSSFNKALTVFVRGEDVQITVLSDNTNSIHHQLYQKAYAAPELQEQKISMQNFVCEYAIFEIDFGKIGAGHAKRIKPQLKETNDKKWFDKISRNKLFVPNIADPISERLSRANMNKVRVCVFHVHHDVATKSPVRVLEFLFMLWDECLRMQVDVIGGDGNSAAYRLLGSTQQVPCPDQASFQMTGKYMIEQHNQAFPDDTISVQFASSNSTNTLFENQQFYAKHGHEVIAGNCDVPDNDWPMLDTMICAVLSYGHSMDSSADNRTRLEERGQEFELDVSDGVTDLTAQLLFLPEKDHDFHSPIWIAMKLPEMNTSKWKNAMKTPGARIRRGQVRADNKELKSEQSGYEWKDNQDTSWKSSSSSGWRNYNQQESSSQGSSWNQPWRNQWSSSSGSWNQR